MDPRLQARHFHWQSGLMTVHEIRTRASYLEIFLSFHALHANDRLALPAREEINLVSTGRHHWLEVINHLVSPHAGG